MTGGVVIRTTQGELLYVSNGEILRLSQHTTLLAVFAFHFPAFPVSLEDGIEPLATIVDER